MRLFIAVHFSAEVRGVLLRCIGDLRRQAVSGNFTRPENLHLTLVFIGESDDVKTIRQTIDDCAVPPFEMTIGGSGRFGDLYWVGIERNTELTALAENLSSSLRGAGFDIETRPFKPHITLARRVEVSAPVRIDAPRTVMTVSRVSLMKSERIYGKLTYTEVYGRAL